MTSEASGAVAADAAPRRFSRCAIASDPEYATSATRCSGAPSSSPSARSAPAPRSAVGESTT